MYYVQHKTIFLIKFKLNVGKGGEEYLDLGENVFSLKLNLKNNLQ